MKTLQLVRRAEQAGYRAVVVTVDAPVSGMRNVQARAGFELPLHIRPVNLDGLEGSAPVRATNGSPVFQGMLDHAAGGKISPGCEMFATFRLSSRYC